MKKVIDIKEYFVSVRSTARVPIQQKWHSFKVSGNSLPYIVLSCYLVWFCSVFNVVCVVNVCPVHVVDLN